MPNSRPISGPSVPSGRENGKTVAKNQFCCPSGRCPVHNVASSGDAVLSSG